MDKQLTEVMVNYLPIAALILAVVSLFLISLLFNKINGALKSIATINQARSVEAERAQKPERKFDESRVTILEASLSQLTEQIKALRKSSAAPTEVETKKTEPVAVVEPAVKADKDLMYFSKFPDLENGFTDGYLKEKQNGEQIYELILTPDQGRGVFYVSDALDAQKYALSDVNYYLPNACNFLNQPGKNVRIKTVEAGTLVRSGENWIIEEKAQIEFV